MGVCKFLPAVIAAQPVGGAGGRPAPREFKLSSRPAVHHRVRGLCVLREIRNTVQVSGEAPRRWFFSHEQDLLVWFGPDGTPTAFQLAYGKYRNEHALRWKIEAGFRHYKVNDGELGGGLGKEAPLLRLDGAFPASKVLRQFLELSAEIPQEIVVFVAQRLREHPEFHDDT